MKMIIASFLFASLPLIAIAGPEDHINETCYSTTQVVSSAIPTTFCFDSIQLDSDKKSVFIDGTYSNLPKRLKVISSIFKTEDKVSFEAQANLVNIWVSGCGDGELADLSISGIWDLTSNENINPKELKILVKYGSTNDTCHSPLQMSEIEYKLAK